MISFLSKRIATKIPTRFGRPQLESLENRLVPIVSTTFLPDPFVNAAPKVFDRSVIVEVSTPTRTPSVLLGQFDVESDALFVAGHGAASHGSVETNNDGTFTYGPFPGYSGSDSFQFTIGDGRGGFTTGTMNVSVIEPSPVLPATGFFQANRLLVEGSEIDLGGRVAVVPRAVDFDGDGFVDLLAAIGGGVLLFRNQGIAGKPQFHPPSPLQAAGTDIRVGNNRLAISWVDVDSDGLPDLVVVAQDDLLARWFRNIGSVGNPVLDTPVFLKSSDGVSDFSVPDIRADVADWNGDGLPDIVTGSFSGSVMVSLNVGTRSLPRFAPASVLVDSTGRSLDGSYNLNARIVDVTGDGVPDLVSSFNWGTINCHANLGSANLPILADSLEFQVTDTLGDRVNFHALADGAIVDFADLDRDGTVDLVAGGENSGTLFLAYGRGGMDSLTGIRDLLAAHPNDLGAFLASPAHSAEKARLRNDLGQLHDFIAGMAVPSRKAVFQAALLEMIRDYPQYFRLQRFNPDDSPGLPAISSQILLTTLMTNYLDPETRKSVCDAAAFPGRDQPGGGYRKLVEDLGLFLFDNFQNPMGAEAIYQAIRNVPRNIYPGTGLTMADWLGETDFLVRGHFKNCFNGYPDNGEVEYGFSDDARPVIGERGNENWYMTVVRHETMHDMDAFVRRSPELYRRWGQVLVRAGGHDANGKDYLAADPATGWFSPSLTRSLWLREGRWNGIDDWDATFEAFYQSGPGALWNKYGFMRGGIEWFLKNSQESLATQGNQFWNSGEGRIQVAIDRWLRGFDSNITEVLFFMDVMSLGLGKMQLCENDGYCDQVISFAELHRDQYGHIDRVTVNGRQYKFTLDPDGRVVGVGQPTAPMAPSRLQATTASWDRIHLAWRDNAANESAYVMERSTDSRFTTKVVSIILPAGATSAMVTGLTPTTTYFFRLKARNAAGDSGYTAPVRVSTIANLGRFTMAVDVGGAKPAGSTQFSGQSGYHLRAGGSGLNGKTDSIHFVSTSVANDVEMIARVMSLRNGTDNARAGLMLRDSLADGSRFAGIFVNQRGDLIFQWRSIYGGGIRTVRKIEGHQTMGQVWLRIVRVGHMVEVFYSVSVASPAPWIRLGASTIPLNARVRGGLVATSGSPGRVCAAVVTSVQFGEMG